MKTRPGAESATGVKQAAFRRRLLGWYDAHKRDLPWRRDLDPYRVWVSEIMLQQTRVPAVMQHYGRFLKRFPNVARLARAREASVLAAWSGLGYYRRARMLHAAAKSVVKEHAGRFPASAQELRALPGIGRYTAAAVASIAYGEAVAVVDGNVERVLGRVLGRHLSGKELWQVADAWLDARRPGDFNQAMMELGALVCLPRQPKCLMCPVRQSCATRGEWRQKERGIRRHREIRYALDCRDGFVFLLRRPDSVSLMPGMWELPEIPHENDGQELWLILRHSITVTDYTVGVMRTTVTSGQEGSWVARARVSKLPLTGLARKILRAAEVI